MQYIIGMGSDEVLKGGYQKVEWRINKLSVLDIYHYTLANEVSGRVQHCRAEVARVPLFECTR